jgi:hypothetical protein
MKVLPSSTGVSITLPDDCAMHGLRAGKIRSIINHPGNSDHWASRYRQKGGIDPKYKKEIKRLSERVGFFVCYFPIQNLPNIFPSILRLAHPLHNLLSTSIL